jgi:integrase
MATRKCLPTGIDVYVGKEKQSIRIFFMYRGVRCRETLDGLEVNDKNIKWAERHRSEIINAIAKSSFNYADYFPNSKNARKLGMTKSKVLIKDLLEEYIETSKRSLQKSTLISYKKAVRNHLLPEFGSIAIQDLSPQHIREWVRRQDLNIKSLKNTLIPLRNACILALNDDILKDNPFDRVFIDKLVDKDQRESEYAVHPFTEDERIQIIESAHGQLKNLVQFAFYSGLRTSELIGLYWTDINFDKDVIHVQRAFVEGEEKVTKTRAGERDVMILPLAMEALRAQKEYSYIHSENVFCNPTTNKPYTSDKIVRTHWIKLLKRAGVVYRNPYQTRHTFASMLLSTGENPLQVAKMMGHVDTSMIFKVYGKWIPQSGHNSGYKLVGDYSKLQNHSKSKVA